jgi:hypothetical protein
MSEYTQGHSEYIFSAGFMHWLPGYTEYQQMRVHFAGGYKIHLSADPKEGKEVARAMLPLLRDMELYHKIVPDRSRYDAMNRGRQQGKLITVYSGPLLHKFLRVTKELDAVLRAHRFTPGPTPSERLGGHARQEQTVGLSRMIFYTTSPDFEL